MGSSTTSPDAGSAPAGWHVDPQEPTRARYWDGTEWTDHVSHDGSTVDRIDGAAHPATAPSAGARLLVLATTVGAMALLVAYGAWKGGADEPSPSAAPSPEPIAAPAPAAPAPDQQDDESPAPAAVADSDSVIVVRPVPPVTIRYRIETNGGDEYEELIAYDPPRSARRTDDGTSLYDDGVMTQCTGTSCRSWENPGFSDHLRRAHRAAHPPDPEWERRTIAGRAALCASSRETVQCWDPETDVVLLYDPGEEAMRPSAFTSTRRTAVEVRPPTEADFSLPVGAEIQE